MGWSRYPQTATQEGDHMVGKEAGGLWDKETVTSLISPLLAKRLIHAQLIVAFNLGITDYCQE